MNERQNKSYKGTFDKNGNYYPFDQDTIKYDSQRSNSNFNSTMGAFKLS